MTSSRLTIFEGADGSGKTTAARAFAASTGAAYVHFGAFPGTHEISRFYAEAMLPALLGYQDLVFDRSWFDEKPYGEAFRHGDDRVGKVGRRLLMRLAMRCGALVIVCAPDWETVRTNYCSRREIEYLETEDQLRHVYDYFVNAADTYPLAYGYDYTRDKFLPSAVHLDRCRTRRHPLALRSAGNWGAPWVLVGEKFTDPTAVDTFYQWPFASFSHKGCSWWLAEQLEEAGVPEKNLLWVNADQDLTLVPNPTHRHFIAMGKAAVKRCEELELPFFEVAHPQYHKRFKFKEAYPLIDLLTKGAE